MAPEQTWGSLKYICVLVLCTEKLAYHAYAESGLDTLIFLQDSNEEEDTPFLLHILDDKKAKLQVNKDALRKAIRRHSEKAMSSITPKARVGRSFTKQAKLKQPRRKYLLPLRSIVRVDTYDSDDQGDGDGQELTLMPWFDIHHVGFI